MTSFAGTRVKRHASEGLGGDGGQWKKVKGLMYLELAKTSSQAKLTGAWQVSRHFMEYFTGCRLMNYNAPALRSSSDGNQSGVPS